MTLDAAMAATTADVVAVMMDVAVNCSPDFLVFSNATVVVAELESWVRRAIAVAAWWLLSILADQLVELSMPIHVDAVVDYFQAACSQAACLLALKAMAVAVAMLLPAATHRLL